MRIVGAALLAAAMALTGAADSPPPTPKTNSEAGAAADASRSTLGDIRSPAPPGPPGSPGPSGSPGSQAERFVLPVPPPPEVLTPFRPPATRYGSGHRGVDLAAPAGASVRAAATGTVVYAGMLAGRGVVSIQHSGGLRTTYEPVTASVSAGDHVQAGQIIGALDAGHPSCAPADCLHWGARLPDGSYLDPMSLLRPWRVRLKPWVGVAGR